MLRLDWSLIGAERHDGCMTRRKSRGRWTGIRYLDPPELCGGEDRLLRCQDGERRSGKDCQRQHQCGGDYQDSLAKSMPAIMRARVSLWV